MNKGYIYILLAVFFWTFALIFVRILLPAIPPEPMLFYRFLFSALTFFVVFGFTRKISFKLNKERIKIFVLLAGVYTLILYTMILAVANTKIVYAQFLQQISPVYTFLMAHLFLKESVRKNVFYALLLSLFGILIVFYFSGAVEGYSLFGNVMAILSGIFLASYTVLSRYAGRKYEPEEMTFWAFVLGTLFLSFAAPQTPSMNLHNWLLLAAFGIFSTALPFLFYIKGLKTLEAQKTSIITLLLNVTVPIAAFFFFQELPNIGSAIGGLLIVTAALIVLKS